jgi:hypothetical protein
MACKYLDINSLNLDPSKSEPFNKSMQYFFWDIVIPSLDCATSKPRKYFRTPRYLILNCVSRIPLILVISCISVPTRIISLMDAIASNSLTVVNFATGEKVSKKIYEPSFVSLYCPISFILHFVNPFTPYGLNVRW